jgi:hypothetical protein
MECGKVPPNWEDLFCLSTKFATDESSYLALKWISGQQLDVNKDVHLVPIQDQISNPFNLVPDQHNIALDSICADFNCNIGTSLGAVSEGGCICLLQVESFSKAAAGKPLPDIPPVERVGIKVNLLKDFDVKAANMSSPPSPSNKLMMPRQVNLNNLGLRCSKHLAEQKERKRLITKHT